MLNKNIIYNDECLVVIPYNYTGNLKEFQFSFSNIFVLKNEDCSSKDLIEAINNNNFKKLIFLNYIIEYNQIIFNTDSTLEKKFIFTYSLASLSSSKNCDAFYNICDLYEKKIISQIGVLDYGLFECLKRKNYEVNYLLLNIPYKENKDLSFSNKEVGILSNQTDPKQNYYNQLSALRFNSLTAKITNPNKVTKDFLKLFDIDYKVVNSEEQLISKSLVNLYINFTLTDINKFISSMDNNVPCILGNCSILDDYDYLKSMLVMNSDDDINEIKDRIETVKIERNKILKEYKKFRNEYSLKSSKLLKNFIGNKFELKNDDKKYDFLLTVVVPVYNTSKYLAESLESIIKARIGEMEILVINDGSTDESEEIILKYKLKYPKLIKYIKQENHGLGNVRNVGLKEASGKYIASIDSDDTIDRHFFCDALPYLKRNVDLVICDWLSISGENRFVTPAIDSVFKTENRYEGLLYTTIMPSTCNKIIKKSIFDKLSIKYIEDKYEDFSTNPFIMFASKTIAYINKPYYRYFIRENSIMRTKPGYSMINVIKQVNERIKIYQKNITVDFDKLLYYMFSWRIEEFIINQLYDIEDSEISDYIYNIEKNLKNILLEMFNNKYYIEMISSLKDDEIRSFIDERNLAIIKGDFERFIIKSRKNNKYYKITPNIIYYGE